MTFAVDGDGTVSYFFVRENQPSMNAACGYFFNWLVGTYPGEENVVSNRTGRMALSDDALELLPIRVAEWIATLEE